MPKLLLCYTIFGVGSDSWASTFSDSDIYLSELIHGSDMIFSELKSPDNSAQYARTANQGGAPIRSSPVEQRTLDQDQINQSILTAFRNRLSKD